MSASDDLIKSSEQVLKRHARSFRWAAPFLGAAERNDAAITYAFCREVDDLADEADDEDEARRALTDVLSELEGRRAARPLVAAYREVARRRGIEASAAYDLVLGVRGDCEEVLLKDDEELLRYCYRVAGTVGLMMAGILGAADERARPHAIHLGMGMQLTNICRDVFEDAGRGRVYLPRGRLAMAGLTQQQVLERRCDEAALFAVVEGLLALAERFYASAEAGMRFLPARARLAVFIAGRLYRGIGRSILRRGPSSLSTRVVVPPARKLAWCAHAALSFLGLTGLSTAAAYDEAARRSWSSREERWAAPPVGGEALSR